MAPPKTPAKAKDGVDTSKSDVTVLCNILVSVTDLKLDNKSLAPILGLQVSSAKNVPRSLNLRLKPYGFEFKAGKIQSLAQEEPTGATTPTTANSDEGGETAELLATDKKPKAPKGAKTPKTPKAPKAAKVPKTPASKKRKIAAVESDDASIMDDDAEVKAEEGNSSDVQV